MQNENRIKYSGGVWKKEAKSGLIYFSGSIEIENKKYSISMFEKKRGANEKSPDYSLILEPSTYTPNSNYQSKTSAYDSARKQKTEPEVFKPEEDEDAPF